MVVNESLKKRTGVKPATFIVEFDGKLLNRVEDWVEVVRCKDCQYLDGDFCEKRGTLIMAPDDYCSYGWRA